MERSASHRFRRRTVAGDLVLVDRQVGGEVTGQDVHATLVSGTLDANLHVEAARTQNRRIDHVLAVGGADDDDVVQLFDAVDLRKKLRYHGGLDIRGDARTAGAEKCFHLIEEDDHGDAVRGTVAGAREDLANLALGFAHVLVEQLGPLMLRK